MNMALMCTIMILFYFATTSTTVIDEFLYLVSYFFDRDREVNEVHTLESSCVLFVDSL